jgi:hypothetical protein
MTARRIVVRPVYQATPLVPFVFAAHNDGIAHLQWDPLGQLEIVGDENGQAVSHADQEPLVR